MNLLSSKQYGEVLRIKRVHEEITPLECCELRDFYDEWLDRELEEWMFVPCDLQGNVIKMPHPSAVAMSINGKNDYDVGLEQYQQALDRVLFSGWRINEKHDPRTPVDRIIYPLEGYSDVRLPFYFANGTTYVPQNDCADRPEKFIISDLLREDKVRYIKLTETAQQEISTKKIKI